MGYDIDLFDRQADKLLSQPDNNLVVTNPYKYLAGSKIAFDYAMNLVGDVTRNKVLDYGCGSGWLAVYLGKLGAEAYGFDISSKLIEVAEKRAEVNGVTKNINLERMVAGELGYPDDFFDKVVGISVLHHIDLLRGGAELSRIMKKGAKAVFIEPLGENRLIEFVRNKINLGLLRKRTPNERPLKLHDIENFSLLFKVNHKEFQLLGSVARYIGDDLAKYLGLNLMDGVLFSLFPAIRKKARLSVISLFL